MKTILKGQLAKEKACKFLQQQGLTLIEKNYRCRNGEIDLIMQDKNQLVFVEVRYRKCESYGTAIETVDQNKINKLISTAQYYISSNQLDIPSRFDVVGFDASLNPNWISNAFSAY